MNEGHSSVVWLGILTRESQAIRYFIDVLTKEQEALRDGHTDQLSALSEEKLTVSNNLRLITEERKQLSAQEKQPNTNQGILSAIHSIPAPSHQIEHLAQLWDTIKSDARQAKELNRINGELIQMRMHYNNKALEILLRQQESFDLYGPDGQSSNNGPNRINQSV